MATQDKFDELIKPILDEWLRNGHTLLAIVVADDNSHVVRGYGNATSYKDALRIQMENDLADHEGSGGRLRLRDLPRVVRSGQGSTRRPV